MPDDHFNKINIRALDQNETVPYNLLLLADPSKALIDVYLRNSIVYIAEQENKTIGVCVLCSLNKVTAEIKNIAVATAYQGKGIGTLLLNHATAIAKEQGFRTLIISTANSSAGQLYLYQKLGFEMMEIRKNFFIDNYAEPIYENGIRCKDMIMLSKSLK
ncbi:MAG: acetyltransferase [Mucilaginibacter sp.]|nr:acetyltransferase [Mucilaginibacter sp.]